MKPTKDSVLSTSAKHHAKVHAKSIQVHCLAIECRAVQPEAANPIGEKGVLMNSSQHIPELCSTLCCGTNKMDIQVQHMECSSLVMAMN